MSVDVANVGDYDGKETVQLYIRDKVASIMRPIIELKGYEKVLIEMCKAGMNVARINFSHADFDNALEIVNSVKEVRKRTGKN